MTKIIRKFLFGLSLFGFPVMGLAQGTVVYTNNPAITKGMKNQGAYASGTTYAMNDVVSYSGGTYLSLVNGNVGHTPNGSPSQWQSVGPTPDSVAAAQATANAAIPATQKGQNNGVATLGSDGKVPASQLPPSGSTLPTTTNLLKGDGNGGAAAATPGTDYATVAAVAAAQSTANAAIPATQKGQASGIATLGSDGKVPSEQLPAGGGSVPVFGPSGPGHAAGIVPDPGATPGTTRVFYEDGTFRVPFSDTTSNTSITYSAGSNGDTSCPTPTAGRDITCYFQAVNANKRSINGGAYQLVPTPVLTTKGDLMVFDTAPARLPIGTNGQYLTPDSTQPTGMKWSDLPSGSGPSGGAGIILKFQSSNAAMTANNDYIYGDLSYPLIDTNGANSMIVPKACTVKRITYTFFAPFGMPSPSGLHATYTLSDQGSGTTLLTTTATDWAGAFHPVVDDVTGLSIALTAGQKLQLKVSTPAWSTNPNTPVFSASIYCE